MVMMEGEEGERAERSRASTKRRAGARETERELGETTVSRET